MKPDTEPATEVWTVAQVLRGLKKFLPPGYTKGTSDRPGVGYSYGDKLGIEVRGVCLWNANLKEKESCRALSIGVGVGYEYRRHPRLRTVILRARKDGTFNLESVGARVQRYLAEIKSIDVILKKEKAKKEIEKKERAHLRDRIRDVIRSQGLNPSMIQSYSEAPLIPYEPLGLDPEDEELNASAYENNPELARGRILNDAKSIDIFLKGLTFQQFTQVFRALKDTDMTGTKDARHLSATPPLRVNR